MAAFQTGDHVHLLPNSTSEMPTSFPNGRTCVSLGQRATSMVLKSGANAECLLLENDSAMQISWSWKAKQIPKGKGKNLKRESNNHNRTNNPESQMRTLPLAETQR